MSRSTKKLILGIAIGVFASMAYYAYIEDTLPERLTVLLPVEMSLRVPEPPTREEVRKRAELLEDQSLLIGLGAMLCVDAHRLLKESESDMERKYPNHHDVGLSDLHQIYDTRVAWDILDDFEGLLKDVERACLR